MIFARFKRAALPGRTPNDGSSVIEKQLVSSRRDTCTCIVEVCIGPDAFSLPCFSAVDTTHSIHVRNKNASSTHSHKANSFNKVVFFVCPQRKVHRKASAVIQVQPINTAAVLDTGKNCARAVGYWMPLSTNRILASTRLFGLCRDRTRK